MNWPLSDLIAGMESACPSAMNLLAKDDLDALRENGFLRPREGTGAVRLTPAPPDSAAAIS